MAFHALYIGVHVQRSEMAAERLVLFRRQAMLTPEEDDMVVQEGLMNLVEGLIREVTGKVHPIDLCAERT